MRDSKDGSAHQQGKAGDFFTKIKNILPSKADLLSQLKFPSWHFAIDSICDNLGSRKERNEPEKAITDKINKTIEYLKTLRLSREGRVSNMKLYNSCAYVIYCPEHDQVAICKPKNSHFVWLPFTVFTINRSWNEGALTGSYEILSGGHADKTIALERNPPYEEAQLIEVFRLQLPQTSNFLVRLMYYIKLNYQSCSTNLCCCQDNDQIVWVPYTTIMKGELRYVWGPEIFNFCRWVTHSGRQKVREIDIDTALFYLPRDEIKNPEEEMLKSAKITEKDVERLYSDYIDHCFPSFYMTVWSFKVYMVKYKFEVNDTKLVRLFNTFNLNRNGFLSFHELLLGLASIEPQTSHGAARVKFVFRYFDFGNKDVLNEDDMRRMVRDMHPRLTEQDIHTKLEESMRCFTIKTIRDQRAISFDEFYKAIGKHLFRGTSSLCRSNKPIFAHISRNMTAQQLEKTTIKDKRISVANVLKKRSYQAICHSCKEKKYSLAPNLYQIRLQVNESAYKPVPTKDQIAVSQLTQLVGGREYSTASPTKKAKSRQNCLELIRMIEDFNEKKGNNANPRGLLQENPSLFFSMFKALQSDAIAIFTKEPKCLTLRPPTFVIGDIHGNLEDLLTMKTSIWSRLEVMNSKLVFLGDYVDRGKWSIECAVYVLAMKVLMPKKVCLLRGNHEVRKIQNKYSFRRECTSKYGDRMGRDVWDMINLIFDRMPIAAVIDDSIFCAHGGIPFCISKLREFNSIPAEVRSPERESSVTWEIMWSDPIHITNYIDVCNLLKLESAKQKGFVNNLKRGTAYYFAEQALDGFLEGNGLTHIIRAHEVPVNGFVFHFDEKCITVFSCSHYCGNDNLCAVVFIDQERMRVIQVNTDNNKPATD